MDIYQKNLNSLKTNNPNLHKKLLEINTNNTFEVFVSSSVDNANILDTRDSIPMYKTNPIDEIATFHKSLEKYKYYKSLYFYGIGNGHLFKTLLQNNRHERIYIVEPELELIYIALNLFDFSNDISTNRLKIIHSEDATSSNLYHFIEEIDFIYFRTYTLNIQCDFYDKYLEDINRLNQAITKIFSYHVNATGNDTTDELLGLKHFIHNLPTMIKNPSLKELTKKAKTTKTAIIVATGPSLAKQLPLLKEIKDYVTIFSVDASLPILEREGIKPDVVTSIERVEATAKFYENTSKEFQKDIVFALTAIVDQKLLDNIKDGQLQLSMRPTGTHYSYMDLHDWGYVGIGMSSANLAYELASMCKFENIVLIGQDLAYGKDGKSHSKNHIFGEDEVKENNVKDDFILAYGKNGEVKTTWVWKLFLNGYIKAIAQNNQEGKIKTINSTEGGAHIEGSLEISFKEVAEKYIDTSKKKENIKLEQLSEDEIIEKLKKSDLKIERAIELGQNMSKKIRKLLKELTIMINKYKKYDTETLDKYLKEKDARKLVDKISAVRDQYYDGEFGTFYRLLISPLITHIEYDIAYWSVQSEGSKRARILKNWKMICVHHEWAYRIMVNVESILKIIEEEQYSIKEALEEYEGEGVI